MTLVACPCSSSTKILREHFAAFLHEDEICVLLGGDISKCDMAANTDNTLVRFPVSFLTLRIHFLTVLNIPHLLSCSKGFVGSKLVGTTSNSRFPRSCPQMGTTLADEKLQIIDEKITDHRSRSLLCFHSFAFSSSRRGHISLKWNLPSLPSSSSPKLLSLLTVGSPSTLTLSHFDAGLYVPAVCLKKNSHDSAIVQSSVAI